MNLLNLSPTEINTIVTTVGIIVGLICLFFGGKYLYRIIIKSKDKRKQNITNKKSTVNDNIITGDVNGDLITGGIKNTYIDCKFETKNEQEVVLYKDKLKDDISKSASDVQISISNFEDLNPGLTLNIGLKKDLTEYFISATKENVTLGNMTFYGKYAIDKLKRFIEYGETVKFKEDEYSFDSKVKGLPDYAENFTEQLILDPHFKQIINTVELRAHSGEQTETTTLLSNMKILNYGNTYAKIKIEDIEFTGSITFYLNHVNGTISNFDVNFSFVDQSLSNCIKTIEFLISLLNNTRLDFYSPERNINLFTLTKLNLGADVDLTENYKFLSMCKNVFDTYKIPEIPLDKISKQDRLYIVLVDSYLNNRNLNIGECTMKFSSNQIELDNSMFKKHKECNLSTIIDLVFNINDVKIQLGKHTILFKNPIITPGQNSNEIYINTEALMYIFNKKDNHN